jgi:hypothetical protein
MPRDFITLADVREPTLTIVCEPCGRRGRCNIQRLIAAHGADMRSAAPVALGGQPGRGVLKRGVAMCIELLGYIHDRRGGQNPACRIGVFTYMMV